MKRMFRFLTKRRTQGNTENIQERINEIRRISSDESINPEHLRDARDRYANRAMRISIEDEMPPEYFE